jgi:hypothetical protein
VASDPGAMAQSPLRRKPLPRRQLTRGRARIHGRASISEAQVCAWNGRKFEKGPPQNRNTAKENPMRWCVIVLAIALAGWMAFDGTRALLLGDYLTPKTGSHAGQLGPWSNIVQAVGIEPRSTFMKIFLALYGYTWLGLVVFYALGREWT